MSSSVVWFGGFWRFRIHDNLRVLIMGCMYMCMILLVISCMLFSIYAIWMFDLYQRALWRHILTARVLCKYVHLFRASLHASMYMYLKGVSVFEVSNHLCKVDCHLTVSYIC
jgi:hypothetical protein